MRKFWIFIIGLFLIVILVGCGDSKKPSNEEKPVEHTHDYGTLIQEVAPGCESEGMKAHYLCNGCGKVFDSNKNETTMDSLKIQPLTHDYSTTWTIERDKHYHTCSRCDKHIDEDNHTLVHHVKVEFIEDDKI